MSATTGIEWTDATWNPIAAFDQETGKRGWFCTHVSPGCENCYAESMNRWVGNHLKYVAQNLDRVTLRIMQDVLEQPLRWRDGRKIFVCSMTDLFLDAVPTQFIARVFAVMALADRHTFQVLTKRPKRMREVLSDPRFWDLVLDEAEELYPLTKRDEGHSYEQWCQWMIEDVEENETIVLPNVWGGTSVESQRFADERIPELLNTPLAIRFLSCEPLLGPVDLQRICMVPQVDGSARAGIHVDVLAGKYFESGMRYIGDWDVRDSYPVGRKALSIDWVIIGGESGSRARPMNIWWAISLVAQCVVAGVKTFVKQLGDVAMEPEDVWRERVATRMLRAKNHKRVPEGFVPLAVGGPKGGGDMSDWPAELRVREFPASEAAA